MLTRFDMHIHLDQFEDPVGTARDAGRDGMGLLCTTTTPRGYLSARELLGGCDNVRVAAGLHPWWLDGRCGDEDVDLLLDLIPEERFVGEVGLDFLEKHAAPETWETQRRVFERICSATAAASRPEGPKVMSIHSVRASKAVLDILRGTGCLESCVCVFHWFSDSSDSLWDAIRAGAYFSLGARSLRTGKGREYAKLIPSDRLLMESDMPWPEDVSRGYAAIGEFHDRTRDMLVAVLGEGRWLAAQNNAARLFGA